MSSSERAVTERLINLKDGLQEIWCRVDTMEARFTSVLTPEPPPPAPTNQTLPGRSIEVQPERAPIHTPLGELETTINRILHRLSCITERCEL